MTEKLKPCWCCGKPADFARKTPTMENPQGVDLKRCKCSDRQCVGSKLCVDVAEWQTRHLSAADLSDEVKREIARQYFGAGFSIGYGGANIDECDLHFKRVWDRKEQNK